MVMDKEKVREEFSAGGVVYRKVKGKNEKVKIEFLVGKHSGYHKWALPKGLVEEGESGKEAALREVEEELGVKAEIVGERLGEIEYWFRADFEKKKGRDAKGEESERRVGKYQEEGGEKIKVHKRVVFYLMRCLEDGEKGWEMEEKEWLSYEEVLKRLAFEGERKMVRKVEGKLRLD